MISFCFNVKIKYLGFILYEIALEIFIDYSFLLTSFIRSQIFAISLVFEY